LTRLLNLFGTRKRIAIHIPKYLWSQWTSHRPGETKDPQLQGEIGDNCGAPLRTNAPRTPADSVLGLTHGDHSTWYAL